MSNASGRAAARPDARRRLDDHHGPVAPRRRRTTPSSSTTRVPDATVDKVIDTVSRRYAHGGPFDVGVPRREGVEGLRRQGERVVPPSARARRRHRAFVARARSSRACSCTTRSRRTCVRAKRSVSARCDPADRSASSRRTSASSGCGSSRARPTAAATSTPRATARATPPRRPTRRALRNLIQQKNSFGVRLLTAGFLNNVDITSSNPGAPPHQRDPAADRGAPRHRGGHGPRRRSRRPRRMARPEDVALRSA